MENLLYNYKLLIAYDGTNFGGWQIQPNALSIQEVLQETAQIILQKPITLIGSGRTDAGVHATGQVAHFKTPQELDLRRFLNSMNGLLPKDIRLLAIDPAPLSFHAQYDAIGKIYHYHLYLRPVECPFSRHYALHLRVPLDLLLLEKAAALLVGTHDFTSFANEAAHGSASRMAIRTLSRVTLVQEEEGLRLEFEANGFLYKMVRNLVGVLLDVGTGKKSLDYIPFLFKAKDRKMASRAVPPHGLFLHQVIYKE